MSPWVWVVIAGAILGTALYVAAEFAAVGVRRSRVRRLAEDGSPMARRLVPFIETPRELDRYVAVSQVGITLSSLILGAFAQATIAVALTPMVQSITGLDTVTAASTAAGVVLVVLTIFHVVLGELVPKSLALQFPTQSALLTVLPMTWSLVVFRPLIALLNGSANGLLRLLGVHAAPHRHVHSPDEIDLLIAESRDGGLLEPDEQRRLQRALKLNQKTAGDLMVGRERMVTVPADLAGPEAVRVLAATPFSRLPVHRGTPDRVIGMLRVKDFVHHYVGHDGSASIDRLIRPIERIRQDLPADQALAELRARRAHLAIVVDAAGTTLGLLTIQDVLSAFLQSDSGSGPA
jgi:CBS domain containing-hemolysin-like protein